MTVVLLIRHAENDYVRTGRLAGRLPGVHLNARGREQAQALAEALRETPLAAVYSSPLERALETAQPVAEAHGLEVVVREGLLELDIGAWQGCTLKQLRRRKLWRVVQGTPSRMRFPDGETFLEAQGRVVAELEALAAQHSPKAVIACVSHADLIKLAVAYYLGLPLDLFQRLTIAPASITALAFLPDAPPRLLTLNHRVCWMWETR